MADLEAANPVYNAQLVGYLGSVLSLHSAEYGRQDAFSLYHRIQEQANRGASSIGGGPSSLLWVMLLLDLPLRL